MAPSGKAGVSKYKLVHPACNHAPAAKAFQTAHLCWQDRIQKERNADMTVSQSLQPSKDPLKQPQKSLSLTALELARCEYHPIGGSSKNNNYSGQFSSALGPKNWGPSGGLKSEYRSQVGLATLPAFGSPPQAAAVDMSASYLPKAVRAEGQRRARADQIEAIRQHGSQTILRLSKGEVPPNNPAEEMIFRGPPPQIADQARARSSGGASVRSRLSCESWGSLQSSPEGQLSRISDLVNEARAIGQKSAKAHQVEPVRQLGQNTIVGRARATGEPFTDNLAEDFDNRRRNSRGSTGQSESWGSVRTNPC